MKQATLDNEKITIEEYYSMIQKLKPTCHGCSHEITRKVEKFPTEYGINQYFHSHKCYRTYLKRQAEIHGSMRQITFQLLGMSKANIDFKLTQQFLKYNKMKLGKWEISIEELVYKGKMMKCIHCETKNKVIKIYENGGYAVNEKI